MAPVPTRISRYEIKARIGSGGMGTLYLARDTNPNTDRLVALKLLNADLDSGDLRERFAREAQSLAALSHPNIVIIYDSGEFEGSPFIVMEYLRGETLAEKIKRRAPMSLATKLKLMSELCEGLAHAHDLDIIHRDIKPANLMVDLHGRLKILDFGIARVVENSLTRVGIQLTQVNVQIGTPGYMSPEQIEGSEIDRRSDLFAAGAVCYELLTYRVAFPGASTRQIEKRVLHDDPTPLASAIPEIDAEIEPAIKRALAKDADDRYQDATTFGRVLEQLRLRLGRVEDEPVLQTPAPLGPTSGSDRRSRRARAAVAAYQRALASQQEGAPDYARRSALEALAEDPTNAEARALLASLGALADVERWLPSSPSPSTPAPGDKTIVDMPLVHANTIDKTRVDATAIGEMQIDPTRIDATKIEGTKADGRTSLRPWRRYVPAIAVAALLVVAASAWMIVSLLPSPGLLLTINRPTGGTLIGGSLKCGTAADDCSANRDEGERVDFQAEPDPGFVFVGFTGDCAPSGRTLMTEPRTCGATFEKDLTPPPPPPSRILTVARPRGGTILGPGIKCGTLGSNCVIEHPDGAQVLLDHLSDKDFDFQAFTGDCAPSGATTMGGPRNCGATFVRSTTTGSKDPAPPSLPDRTLTVSPPSGGTIVGAGINCGTAGANCSVVHPNGIPIQLTAMPDANYVFTSFTGDCGSDGKMLMNGPRSCGATFKRTDAAPSAEHTLTIIKPQNGTIDGAGLSCGTVGSNCLVNLANGRVVRLEARPDEGYTLSRFTGDCSPNDGTTTMSQARTCSATFEREKIAVAGPPRNPKHRQTWTNPADELVMVWIDTSQTDGKFLMSSPATEAGRNPANEGTGQFERTLRGFWIDQTEVTREAFRRFVDRTGRFQKGPDYQGEDSLPVVKVTWQEARAFCESAGNRLPTEVEWEYTARAASTRRYPWGSDTFNDQFANAGDALLAAKRKPANNFGVFDMIGNVWEWTSSLFRPYPYDPSREDAAAPGDRVIRGGAFGQNRDFLRIAARFPASPGTRSDQGGFRCAR